MLLNKQSTKIAGNFSIRIVGNIISKLLGLITLPIVTRALGPETFGEFSLVTLIIGYAVIVTDFGFIVYGIRGIANDDENVLKEVLSAKITLSIISIIISFIVVLLVYHESPLFVIIIFIGLVQVLAMGANIDFYFFGKGKMLVPTLSQIVGNLIYVAGVLIFIRNKNDLIWLVLFYTLYQIVATAYGWIFFLRNKKLNIQLSIKNSFLLIAKTYKLGIAQKIEMFVSSFPVFMITLLLGVYLLGIYSAAIIFYTIIILVFQNLMLAAAPFLVKLKKNEENKRINLLIKLSLTFVLLGIFSSLFLYFTCEWIISILYGGQYVEAVSVVKQMCLYLIPFIPISMFLNNVLVFFGYDKSYLITMVSGMVFNIISSILLIKYFSLMGAVLAIGITALTFIAVSTYFLIKNNKPEVYNEVHL